MTTSLTRTSTFTFTDAVYVGSKLGAAGGQLRNDTPGGLPLGLSMNGYAFHSFLTYSSAFHALGSDGQTAFTATLPVQRTGGVEPTANSGSYGQGSQYSRNGVGLSRDVYVAF